MEVMSYKPSCREGRQWAEKLSELDWAAVIEESEYGKEKGYADGELLARIKKENIKSVYWKIKEPRKFFMSNWTDRIE